MKYFSSYCTNAVHLTMNDHTFNLRIFSLWRVLFRRLQLHLWSKVPRSMSNKIMPNLLLWWWDSPTTTTRQSSLVSWVVLSQIVYLWASGKRNTETFSREKRHCSKMQRWRTQSMSGSDKFSSWNGLCSLLHLWFSPGESIWKHDQNLDIWQPADWIC